MSHAYPIVAEAEVVAVVGPLLLHELELAVDADPERQLRTFLAALESGGFSAAYPTELARGRANVQPQRAALASSRLGSRNTWRTMLRSVLGTMGLGKKWMLGSSTPRCTIVCSV